MVQPKIVVVGSSNTDMVVKTEHLPCPGETVAGGKFLVVQGGKGANQAVAAARLGGQVVFIARLGNDMFARNAIKGYQNAGLDTRFITLDQNSSTGVALIVVDDQGENAIAVASGANHLLCPEDVAKAETEIAQADIIISQMETPLETLLFTAELAQKHRVPMVLDPAPYASIPDSFLKHLYCIKPNELEAQQMTGVAVHDYKTAQKAADKMIRRGAQNVIITMGAQGSLLVEKAGEGRIIPAYKVNAIDTTAAGDAYCGALAFALGRKMNLYDAAVLANKAAAFSVTRLGAQPSMPTEKDLAEDHR